MSDAQIRIRANRNTGELEIQGPSGLVNEWWDKLWPTFRGIGRNEVSATQSSSAGSGSVVPIPGVFGEFFQQFRSDVTDIDRVLIAAAFVQGQEAERTFTTKSANQALLDQNVKVSNASAAVRRLVAAKRAFAISDGRFRVSSGGYAHLDSLKMTE